MKQFCLANLGLGHSLVVVVYPEHSQSISASIKYETNAATHFTALIVIQLFGFVGRFEYQTECHFRHARRH